MEEQEKEYYIHWIIADYTPFEYNNKSYFISTPSRQDKFLAERFFISVYHDAIKESLFDTEDIKKLLYKNNIWSDEKETYLNNLVKDLDDIKLKLYDNYANTTKRNDYRKALRDTEKIISSLLLEKQSFDSYSAAYVANMAKQHYLMGSSIYKINKKPLFRKWWNDKDDDIVQHCYQIMSEYILTDTNFRELAKTNTWRNIWSSRKAVGSLFGKPVVDLSSQQRQLVMWSNIYDSVYKSAECPSDDIINDDDALDGWMIKQRREREYGSNKDNIENSLTNEKIRNSEQVYVMCDSTVTPDVVVDSPDKVYECNDAEGKMRFKRIMKQIQQEGCVSYMGLKDSQMEIYRKAHEVKGIK